MKIKYISNLMPFYIALSWTFDFSTFKNKSSEIKFEFENKTEYIERLITVNRGNSPEKEKSDGSWMKKPVSI